MKQQFSTQHFLSLTVIFVLFVTPVLATTIHVPTDSTTIQAAINGAQDGDTVLVAPGTYTGPGNRKIELLGKEVLVISEAGADETTIDAEGESLYGFYIHQGEGIGAIIKGFRIINATFTGVHFAGGAATVQDCIMEGNTRGLYLQGSSAVIEGCTIRNNTPGGGVYTWSGANNAIVRNCLIAGNYTNFEGGGIYVVNSDSPTYINCTITGNSAGGNGGGAFASFSRSLRMRNCIVWGNTAPEKPNIDASTYDITYSNIEGICLPNLGNISQDPDFLDTLYHLTISSPCIDVASPADGLDPDNTQINMGCYGNTTDAAIGNSSLPIFKSVSPESGPTVGGGTVTITGQRFGDITGNVVFGGNNAIINSWTDTLIECIAPGYLPGMVTVGVTNTQTLSSELTFGYRYEGAAVFHVPSEFLTIQEAIYCAADGDTILVAPGTYTGEGNRKIELLGKEVLVVSEAGADQTTIDAEGESPYGFYIHQGEGIGAVIKGFRVINATSAGVHFAGGAATVQDCIMEGNTRGLYLQGSSAVVEGCTILNNSPGGGVYSWSGANNGIVRNCLIAENFTNFEGSGIYAGNGHSPTYINCTVVGNTAGGSGGGAYTSNGWSLRMRNCIVWGNEATEKPNIDAYAHDIS